MTLAVRRCCACARLLGLRLWPWSGQWWVSTHGLCLGCYDREDSALEGLESGRAG